MALQNQVKERVTVLVVTAFGLVAALAWNDAVKSAFTAIFGTPDNLIAQLAYAFVVTVIAVVVTLLLGQNKQ